MAKAKFPTLIYVTRENDGHGNDWLQVQGDGVFGVEQSGTPIAIYKLVEVGVVQVLKSFQKPSQKR